MKNNNNKEKLIIVFLFVLTLLFIAVICITTKGFGIIINFIVLTIMIIFIAYSVIKHLGKAVELKDTFINATSELDDQAPEEVANSLCKELRDKYKMDSLEGFVDNGAGVNGYSFIDDYIGVNIADEVIKKELSDNIGGAMTGLGILGTFVGLVVGLRKFNIDASTDVKEMQNSISVLLMGIRTAFLTSIFGVAYSILYNLLYNSIYIDTVNSIEEFRQKYNKCSKVHKGSDFLSTIEKNSDTQTKLIQSLSNDISFAISSELKQFFEPMMSKFDGMVKNIYQQSVSSHNESLKIIVDDFVEQMNTSLGDSFKNLSLTIAQINETTASSYERINAATDKFNESLLQITDISETLKQGGIVIRGYIDDLNAVSQNVKTLNDQLVARIDFFSEQENRQSAAMTYIMEMMPALQAEVSSLNKSFADFEEVSRNYVSTIEGMKQQLAEQVAIQISLSNQTAEKVTKTADDVSNSIVKMSTDNGKLINEQFSEVIDNCNKMIIAQNNMVSQIIELLKNSVSEIRDSIQKVYTNLDNDFETVLNKTFDQFDTELANISSNLSSTIVSNNETIRELSNYSSELPMRIADATDGMIKELEDTVTKLVNVKEKINSYESINEVSNEDTSI